MLTISSGVIKSEWGEVKPFEIYSKGYRKESTECNIVKLRVGGLMLFLFLILRVDIIAIVKILVFQKRNVHIRQTILVFYL